MIGVREQIDVYYDLCGPVMNWKLVHGVTLPCDSWEEGIENGWMDFFRSLTNCLPSVFLKVVTLTCQKVVMARRDLLA